MASLTRVTSSVHWNWINLWIWNDSGIFPFSDVNGNWFAFHHRCMEWHGMEFEWWGIELECDLGVIVQELNGFISVGIWMEWFHFGISIPKPWTSLHKCMCTLVCLLEPTTSGSYFAHHVNLKRTCWQDMNHGQSDSSMVTIRMETTHGLTYSMATAIEVTAWKSDFISHELQRVLDQPVCCMLYIL